MDNLNNEIIVAAAPVVVVVVVVIFVVVVVVVGTDSLVSMVSYGLDDLTIVLQFLA